MNLDPNFQSRTKKPASGQSLIVDCDIHPIINARSDLYPWLDKQWQEVLEQFGAARRRGVQSGSSYPKSQPEAVRRDAWPEGGGAAGGNLALMQKQHLDTNKIALGVLNPSGGGSDIRNPGLSAAYCHATNEWQLETFVSKEPRLRASVVCPYNNPPLAVKEIALRAGDPRFYHVMAYTRTADPFGNQRYWPIFEAAEAAGLPIGIHAFGDSGYPVTSGGWPSFYFEEMFNHSTSAQAVVMSLVIEGVFERFPKLRVFMIEGGMAWLASLCWRMDTHWRKYRKETPHLKRPPSEYVREHVWVTTQPIEEPENREHLLETIEWIGWDRICFSSDYPHWDFDDPMFALPLSKLTQDQREKFLGGNARELFSYRRALDPVPVV